MLRGIGGRQRHGDNKIGGREAEQDEHQRFALPPRKQVFEHGNRALPGEASSSDLEVHGQCTEHRNENKNQGRKRRHRTRC